MRATKIMWDVLETLRLEDYEDLASLNKALKAFKARHKTYQNFRLRSFGVHEVLEGARPVTEAEFAAQEALEKEAAAEYQLYLQLKEKYAH